MGKPNRWANPFEIYAASATIPAACVLRETNRDGGCGFAAMTYVLVNGLRRLALQATDLAQATCATIRRKLFKIGALVTISVRRIRFGSGRR